MPRRTPPAVLAILLTALGCGMLRETLPERSAMEQLLISTATDRAVAALPAEPLSGRRVFIDDANLEAVDKPYVVQRVRHGVLLRGATLVDEPAGADLVLELASGGISMDKRSYLLGIPQITLALPLSESAVVLPELAIFKLTSYQGRAKLLVTPLVPGTGALGWAQPPCYGRSLTAYWTALLFFGPYEWTNLPEEARKEKAWDELKGRREPDIFQPAAPATESSETEVEP